MQIETGHTNVDVTPLRSIKRRLRTDAGRLRQEAERRRNHANAMVVVSIVAVLALVKIFYALLAR